MLVTQSSDKMPQQLMPLPQRLILPRLLMVTALKRMLRPTAIQQSQVTLFHLIASNSYIVPVDPTPAPEPVPAKPKKVYQNQALGWAAYEIAYGTFMGIFIPIIVQARNKDCWSMMLKSGASLTGYHKFFDGP
jgi:hypothetical protein